MKINRAEFLKISVITGIYIQIPFLSTCEQHKLNTKPLSTDEYNTLYQIQEILFPNAKGTPSAESIKSVDFLLKILNDPFYDKEQKHYLIKGIKWMNETAQEDHKKDFIQLSLTEQKKLINKISTLDWGESWLSFNLTIIFEALLSDPIYGSNTNETGWKWTEHTSGYPRASKSLIYPTILKTIRIKTI